MSSDEEQPLHERIKLTRRKTLASLGAMAGGASLASGQLDNGEQENLAAGGMATALGQQYARERYFTSPSAAVDTSQMKAGEKMHVTDTGEFFVWDGDTKVHPPLGSSSNPVPAVTTDETTIATPAVRAYLDTDYYKDFKVSDYADVSAAIQAANDALSGTYGGEVKIGAVHTAGNLSQTITPKEYATLKGTGLQSTRLKAVSGFTSPLVDIHADGEDFFMVGLEQMQLVGDGAAASGRGVYAHTSNGGKLKDVEMERVWVHDVPDEGFYFGADTGWGFHLDKMLAETCGSDGFYFAGADQMHLDHFFTAYNDGRGMYFAGRRSELHDIVAWKNSLDKGLQIAGPRNEIVGCRAYINGTEGFDITGNENTFIGCHAENNSQNSTQFYRGFISYGDNNTFIGCYGIDTQATATQKTGFRVSGANTLLVGCHAYGNSGPDIEIASGATDTRLYGCRFGTITDNGTRTLINGVGAESANAETPSSSWPVGATIDFTDTGDGSGTGVYTKLPDGSWYAT